MGIYALVPEVYRQKCRGFHKPESLTYVEFITEKEMLFDRWLSSQKVVSFQALRDLMILEDFKNVLPQSIFVCCWFASLCERLVTTVLRRS